MSNSFSQLIWLGAGSASQPVNVISQADKVLLIEARAAACQQLNKQFSQQSHVEVKQAVVSERGGEVDFTECNLAEFSAIHPATGLKELFPGLKALDSQNHSSVGIADLLQPHKLSGDNNALIIDITDISLGLLKQLQAEKLLAHFSQIWLQSSDIALYKGAATEAELVNWLKQHGFMPGSRDSTDPDLPWLQFNLNPLWQQLQQCQTALEQITEQKQQLVSEKQQTGQAKAELTKQLDALKQQVVSEKQQTEKNSNKLLRQIEEQKYEAEQKVQQLQQQLANKGSENETLQQQLAAVKVAAEKTHAELNGRVTGMDAELTKALHQLETANLQITAESEKTKKQEQALGELNIAVNKSNADLQQLHADNRELKAQLAVYRQWQDSQAKQFNELQQKVSADLTKSLTNNVKQIECFNSLRDLLSVGQMPLNYHGWPISADIALYLAKKVVTENFDCIIEFGSGTSTVVFARALQARQQITTQDNNCSIISFEHNKIYLQKTADDLKAHQVDKLTELVYAPLVELQCDEQPYLYYSCDARLAELSQALQGKDAKILVLVDGPPASTGPMARYPAIPLILKHLAKHQLHIVMDDYVREDEKKAAGLWSKLFEERGIKHQKELLNFEKVGFSWILNN